MTVEEKLARLPEYERAAVEGMIFELCHIKGVGADTALTIIRRTFGYLLAAKRAEQRGRNGRAGGGR